MREYIDSEGRFEDATVLGMEIEQLEKLMTSFPDLTDDEYAHRMATTKKQVARMKKILQQGK